MPASAARSCPHRGRSTIAATRRSRVESASPLKRRTTSSIGSDMAGLVPIDSMVVKSILRQELRAERERPGRRGAEALDQDGQLLAGGDRDVDLLDAVDAGAAERGHRRRRAAGVV